MIYSIQCYDHAQTDLLRSFPVDPLLSYKDMSSIRMQDHFDPETREHKTYATRIQLMSFLFCFDWIRDRRWTYWRHVLGSDV